MAAETYVDLNAGDDVGGDGSIGNPFLTIQHVHDNVAQDPEEHTVWITGSAVQAGITAGAWAHVEGNATAYRGYGTTPGDGVKATLNGGGAEIWTFNPAGTCWRDLEFTNTGVNRAVGMQRSSSVLFCDFHDGAGTGFDAMCDCSSNSWGMVIGCRFWDAAVGLMARNNALIAGNLFMQGSVRAFTHAVEISSTAGPKLLNNVFSLNGSSRAIHAVGSYPQGIIGNTFFSTTSVATAINMTRARKSLVMNNYVEGFSQFINQDRSSEVGIVFGYNARYNVAGPDTIEGLLVTDLGTDVTLTASGLAKVGDPLNLADWLTYFAPIDQDQMLSAGHPEAGPP